jgi:hypothetical protein
VNGVGFFECSAKSGDKVEEIFTEMARILIRKDEDLKREIGGDHSAAVIDLSGDSN